MLTTLPTDNTTNPLQRIIIEFANEQMDLAGSISTIKDYIEKTKDKISKPQSNKLSHIQRSLEKFQLKLLATKAELEKKAREGDKSEEAFLNKKNSANEAKQELEKASEELKKAEENLIKAKAEAAKKDKKDTKEIAKLELQERAAKIEKAQADKKVQTAKSEKLAAELELQESTADYNTTKEKLQGMETLLEQSHGDVREVLQSAATTLSKLAERAESALEQSKKTEAIAQVELLKASEKAEEMAKKVDTICAKKKAIDNALEQAKKTVYSAEEKKLEAEKKVQQAQEKARKLAAKEKEAEKLDSYKEKIVNIYNEELLKLIGEKKNIVTEMEKSIELLKDQEAVKLERELKEEEEKERLNLTKQALEEKAALIKKEKEAKEREVRLQAQAQAEAEIKVKAEKEAKEREVRLQAQAQAEIKVKAKKEAKEKEIRLMLEAKKKAQTILKTQENTERTNLTTKETEERKALIVHVETAKKEMQKLEKDKIAMVAMVRDGMKAFLLIDIRKKFEIEAERKRELANKELNKIRKINANLEKTREELTKYTEAHEKSVAFKTPLKMIEMSKNNIVLQMEQLTELIKTQLEIYKIKKILITTQTLIYLVPLELTSNLETLQQVKEKVTKYTEQNLQQLIDFYSGLYLMHLFSGLYNAKEVSSVFEKVKAELEEARKNTSQVISKMIEEAENEVLETTKKEVRQIKEEIVNAFKTNPHAIQTEAAAAKLKLMEGIDSPLILAQAEAQLQLLITTVQVNEQDLKKLSEMIVPVKEILKIRLEPIITIMEQEEKHRQKNGNTIKALEKAINLLKGPKNAETKNILIEAIEMSEAIHEIIMKKIASKEVISKVLETRMKIFEEIGKFVGVEEERDPKIIILKFALRNILIDIVIKSDQWGALKNIIAQLNEIDKNINDTFKIEELTKEHIKMFKKRLDNTIEEISQVKSKGLNKEEGDTASNDQLAPGQHDTDSEEFLGASIDIPEGDLSE